MVYNFEAKEQRFFQGHDDEVMVVARHPTSDICASGQLGRPARVCVYDDASRRIEASSTFFAGPTSRGKAARRSRLPSPQHLAARLGLH